MLTSVEKLLFLLKTAFIIIKNKDCETIAVKKIASYATREPHPSRAGNVQNISRPQVLIVL